MTTAAYSLRQFAVSNSRVGMCGEIGEHIELVCSQWLVIIAGDNISLLKVEVDIF